MSDSCWLFDDRYHLNTRLHSSNVLFLYLVRMYSHRRRWFQVKLLILLYLLPSPLPCYSTPPHILVGTETLYWWETIQSWIYRATNACKVCLGGISNVMKFMYLWHKAFSTCYRKIEKPKFLLILLVFFFLVVCCSRHNWPWVQAVYDAFEKWLCCFGSRWIENTKVNATKVENW